MQRSILLVALLTAAGLGHATAFTYQGTLADAGKPAEGEFDLRLTVLDPSGQFPVALPLTLHAVKVRHGNFSTVVDFGQEFADASKLKLGVEVQSGSAGFNKLGEPTPLVPDNANGVCWETGGNSAVGVPDSVIGTNLATDPALFFLRARGDDILYVRGTSGGVEQNNSTASGTGAAAWNTSVAAGDQSFTAGSGSTSAAGTNSVVFADGTAGPFTSVAPNQFLVRADGGMFLNVATTNLSGADFVLGARPIGGDLDADLILSTRNNKVGRIFLADSDGHFVLSSGSLTGNSLLTTNANGASLSAGGTWTNGSSRAFKLAFIGIDPLEVLAKVMDLPITSWTYKDSSEGRHVGPMAEDFRAAFGFGTDAQHISTVDADGIALAAIQGLNQKLEAENALLKARLDALEARVEMH